MIGGQEDIAARLRRFLPYWFGPTAAPTPVLTSLLNGIAWALATIFELIEFAKRQARIATATGGWLDLAAMDYFGEGLPRFKDETDASYRTRIRQEVFRQRNTRAAIDSIVYDLTGEHPRIYEAWRPADTGGWGVPTFAWGRSGYWGSGGAPYEVIVHMQRPQGYGIPDRGGWGSGVGGWGIGNFSWLGEESIQGSGPTITDILNRIDSVRAAGVTIYVKFREFGTPPE